MRTDFKANRFRCYAVIALVCSDHVLPPPEAKGSYHILLLLILTEIQLSLGGSSPYTSTDKT